MPDTLTDASTRPKRSISRRTERVVTEAVTNTANDTYDDPRFAALREDVLMQVKHEVRILETHVSEVHGSTLTAYEALRQTVENSALGLTTAITDLGTKVQSLSEARIEVDAFMTAKRAEESAKARQNELDAVAAQTRAAIVLEQQAIKEETDKITKAEQQARASRRNRFLTFVLTTDGSLIIIGAGYLVTGSGYQTVTSRVTAFGLIAVLLLFAGICLWFMRPPEDGL